MRTAKCKIIPEKSAFFNSHFAFFNSPAAQQTRNIPFALNSPYSGLFHQPGRRVCGVTCLGFLPSVYSRRALEWTPRSAGGILSSYFSNAVLGRRGDHRITDGLTADNGAPVTVRGSIIVGNNSEGIFAGSDADVVAINNTIHGNSQGVVADGGGTTIELTNSLVMAHLNGIVVSNGGTVSSSFTNVFNSMGMNFVGMTDPTGTSGNLSVDPLYVGAANGDFELSQGSPAIDAGTGTRAPTTDHLGNARSDDPNIVNTVSGVPNFVDLGALERIAVTLSQLPGDYDNNQVVEDDDYEPWKSTFGQTGQGLAADGDNNNQVDAADYAIWRNHIGTSTSSVSPSAAQTSAIGTTSGSPVIDAAVRELSDDDVPFRRRRLPRLDRSLARSRHR